MGLRHEYALAILKVLRRRMRAKANRLSQIGMNSIKNKNSKRGGPLILWRSHTWEMAANLVEEQIDNIMKGQNGQRGS